MKLSSLSQLPCKIMAVLLHFFFLCAFAWMLVEGLHLYSMVIKVFGSEGSKHFYYYAIGWGEYNILQHLAKCGECSRPPQSGILYWHSMPSLTHDIFSVALFIEFVLCIHTHSYELHTSSHTDMLELTYKSLHAEKKTSDQFHLP